MASPEDCLVVPARSSFNYLNEGAANIVYRFSVIPGTPPPSSIEEYHEGEPRLSDEELLERSYGPFDNKLIRLRKNLPTTVPCAIAQRDWLKHIRLLFEKGEVVEQCLVQIRDAKVVERLNEELKGWERPYPMKGSLRGPTDYRPTKRNGIYLADDEHGLLVTDMTPGDDDGTMEFKPKWLAQSPSAPKTAIRCRQCAREARKNAQLAAKGEILARIACVLDLVSEDPKDLLTISQTYLHSGGPHPSPASDFEVRRFARWLAGDNLLRRLRDLQVTNDTEGPLAADVESVPFRVAMTLRDCTVFIRWPKHENGKVESRLGDLDLKSPEKKKYWQDMERELIDEGWYDGTEPQKDWQPLNCHLNPNRYKFDQGRPTPTV